MKHTLLILLAATICYSCNNVTTTTTATTTTTTTSDSVTTIIQADPRHDLVVLDSVLRQFHTPMQQLKASVVHPSTVTGAKGTVITITPDELETISGKPLGNHIDIALKELTTTEELARDRAATVADGKLLVSGGAYYINLTSDGEQLRLKPGKTLKVQLANPLGKEMSMFAGQKDSLGQMNWKEDNTMQKRVETEVAEESDQSAEEANNPATIVARREFELQQFGWINCDRFITGNLTTLTVDIDQSDTVDQVFACIIFKDINSVMAGYFQSSRQQCTFPNIPIGSKVAFIAIGLRNGRMFAIRDKIAATKDKKVAVRLKEMQPADITALFRLN